MKNDTRNYKYAAPTALVTTAYRIVIGSSKSWNTEKPGALPHDLRFTIY